MPAAAGRDPLRAGRLLRRAALLLIIPLAAYVVYSLLRGTGREPASPADRGVSAGAPSSEMKEFSFDQTDEGKSLYSMRAGRLLGTEGGVYLLEEVRDFTIHRAGSTWVINAPRGELVAPDGKLSSIRLEGGVRVEQGSSRNFETPVLTYDNESGRLHGEGGVRFTEGSIGGEAAGLSRDLESGSTMLEGPVTLRGEGDALGGWIVRAAGMRRASDSSPLELLGPIGLERGGDHVQAQSATIPPTAQGQSAVLQGLVRGTLDRRSEGGGSGPAAAAPVDFACDRLEVEREATGAPSRARLTGSASIATGDVTTGSPILQAPEIATEFSGTGDLRSLSAKGGVTLQRDVAGVKERLAADALDLGIGAEGGIAGTANGNVRIARGTLTAGGAEARFDSDRITLTGNRPWARDGGRLVLADSIEMERGSGTLTARGGTRTTIHPTSGENAGASAFPGFRTGEPIFVSASEAEFLPDGASVRFTGPVRAWQEESSLQSDAMEVTKKPGIVNATGHALLRGTRRTGEGKTVPFTISSSTLRYEMDARRLTCTGGATYSEDGTSLRARSLTATGSADSGAIDRVVAEGDVEVAAASRTGRSDRAEFRAAEDLITLTGDRRPATLHDGRTGRDVSAASLTLDLAANTITIPGERGERARIEVRDMQRADDHAER